MKLLTKIGDKNYFINSEQATSIAINLKFDGEQPNHFGANIASRKPLAGGGFIGDTTQGGSCNVDSISLVPHCNGTHTESIHHVVDQQVSIGSIVSNSLSSCKLVTIEPQLAVNLASESYIPALETSDLVISKQALQNVLGNTLSSEIEALAIRTLPNDSDKQARQYDEQNQPPFFSQEAMVWISQSNIKHLLVDFPSLDKMYDDGHLSNHHTFWNIAPDSHQLKDDCHTERTVTEMIFVPNTLADGLYCLNLQVPAFELDAAPSRPLLYPLIEISN